MCDSGWIDLNKNGGKDVFADRARPIEKRVEDLLPRMNAEITAAINNSRTFVEKCLAETA